MNDNPWIMLLLAAGGVYAAHLWWTDYSAARAGRPPAPGAMPGTTPAKPLAILIAVAGTIALLAAETAGEIALGLDQAQSKMTVLGGLYTLIASVIEEIIFRGFVVVEKRGRSAFLGGIIGASLLFALLHPFLWSWDADGFSLTLTAKGWFSFGAVFVGSLWFYTCRFAPWNPTRSLLPCFAAHFSKNAGVFVLKAAQGFITGIW